MPESKHLSSFVSRGLARADDSSIDKFATSRTAEALPLH